MSRFAGFRSRWMIPLSCTAFMPLQHCSIHLRICFSFSRWPGSMYFSRVTLSTHSMMRKTRPSCVKSLGRLQPSHCSSLWSLARSSGSISVFKRRAPIILTTWRESTSAAAQASAKAPLTQACFWILMATWILGFCSPTCLWCPL